MLVSSIHLSPGTRRTQVGCFACVSLLQHPTGTNWRQNWRIFLNPGLSPLPYYHAPLKIRTLLAAHFSGFNFPTPDWRALSLHPDLSHRAPGPQPSTSLEFSSRALCLVYTGTQRLGAPNSQSTGFLPLLFTMLSYT